MCEQLALDHEADGPRLGARELQGSEPVCRKVWRERATRDAHDGELVVELRIAAAHDRGAARAEVGGAGWRRLTERERDLRAADADEPRELERELPRGGDGQLSKRPARNPDVDR